MSGFQGFGCCSALFSPLIRRADIQPSTTTPGALGIKGLHTDFSKGRAGEGEGGKIFERWATPKETILRKTERMSERKGRKIKSGRTEESPREEKHRHKERDAHECQRAEERH